MVTVNLMPDSLLLAQLRRRHLRRWIVSGGCAMLALFFALAMDWWRAVEAGELRAEDGRILQELDAVRVELRAVSTDAEQVFVQIQRADALRAKRAWSGMLALLGECLPEPCWLTSISTDPVRPTGVAPRPAAAATAAPGPTVAPSSPQAVTIESPRKLAVIGYAAEDGEPHAFVTKLKGSNVFREVTLVRCQREPLRDGYSFRFEVVCEW